MVPLSPSLSFEAAVDALVSGNAAALSALLAADPSLVHARSSLHPHRATLLHYIAANGVEDARQITPPNVVALAAMLLRAGADPNALAACYGGECTTLALLVSSCHPAAAGLQSQLVDTLVDYGASVEACGHGAWTSPLLTALAFGYLDAAQTLVRRGARVTSLAAAAGLGLLAESQQLLDAADDETRHRAFALAAQNGHAPIVELLLDAGADPNRYNPEGNHAHSTPLHQAALGGHLDVVRLLVRRGASVDCEDTIHHATPLSWALHGKQSAVAAYLQT
jgi:ankyrin repeat protein